MKKMIFPVIILSILVFCSAEKKAKEPVVEIIDGVEYVHNPAEPVYPEKSVVFEEELTLTGENAKTGEVYLYEFYRFFVNKNGYIFVPDVTEYSIKIFDENGKYIKAVGRKGQGPGEFQYISHIDFLSNGKMIVVDSNGRRYSIFNKDWEFERLFGFNESAIVMKILAIGDSTIILESGYRKLDPEPKSYLSVLSFGFDGYKKCNFGDFTPRHLETYRLPKMNFEIRPPYYPESMFTADKENLWLYHCLNDKYVLEVYDKNGKKFRQIDRRYKPVAFTKADADKYLSEYKKSKNPEFKKLADKIPLPEVKTISDVMVVDDKNNLWIQTNERKEENGKIYTAYDIFNINGIYAAKVWCDLPEWNWIPVIFKNGKLYCLYIDPETEAKFIKRYNVKWIN